MTLFWIIALMTAEGPMQHEIRYPDKFVEQKECNAYADAMQGRMADWVRGRIQVRFDFPVTIDWRCEPDGAPA